MGSLAHKGSTLPIRTCLPVDKNTTFLAHYDVTAEESLFGIAPISNIATLRPFEGKYGGGIAIEENTTNLLSSLTATAQNGGNVIGYLNTPVTSVVDNTSPIGYSYFVDVNERVTGDPSHSTHGVIIGEATNVGTNTTITYSCYVKFNKPGIPFSVQGRAYPNQGEGLNSQNYTSTGDWQRVSVTYTTNSTQTTGGFQILVIGSNRIGTTFNVTMIQCEKKPFATSFVIGTRDRGILEYPTAGILNPNAGTINVWVNVRDDLPDHYWRMIFVTKDNGRLDGTETNQIRMGFVNNWYTWHWKMTGPTGGDFYRSLAVTKGWHMFTITWDKTTGIKYYYDGQLKYSTTDTTFIPSQFYPTFWLGTWLGIDNSSNHVIDELRIDNIARTPEEIEQWYHSQAPFYPKGVHRVYA